MPEKKEQIVLFDGDCAFCNRIVAFVLENERNDTVYFSPIQSDFSNSFFVKSHLPPPDMNTFYFIQEGKIYQKSTAAMLLSRNLKFPYSSILIGWIIPRFIRDAIYNLIARKRHKLAKGYCFVPTESQKKRIL